jgi:hypothetical protein
VPTSSLPDTFQTSTTHFRTLPPISNHLHPSLTSPTRLQPLPSTISVYHPFTTSTAHLQPPTSISEPYHTPYLISNRFFIVLGFNYVFLRVSHHCRSLSNPTTHPNASQSLPIPAAHLQPSSPIFDYFYLFSNLFTCFRRVWTCLDILSTVLESLNAFPNVHTHFRSLPPIFDLFSTTLINFNHL